MKIAMLSDCHILIACPRARLDDAVVAAFNKMEFVLEHCDKIGAILLIAGDLTEKPRSWHLLPRILNQFSNYPDVRKYAVFGQHDVYMYSEEAKDATILGALYNAGLVKILSENFIRIEKINLYGCSYGQDIPKVENKKEKNILVIHAPIADRAMFSNQNYIDARSFMKENKDYDIILCGDIHRSFCIGSKEGGTILNTGPMVRKTADGYNFTHKPFFYVYDTETEKLIDVDIPHLPAEQVLSRDHIDEIEEKEILRSKFTDSLSREVELDMSFVSNLELFLRRRKNIRRSVRNIIVNELSEIGEKT